MKRLYREEASARSGNLPEVHSLEMSNLNQDTDILKYAVFQRREREQDALSGRFYPVLAVVTSS